MLNDAENTSLKAVCFEIVLKWKSTYRKYPCKCL